MSSYKINDSMSVFIPRLFSNITNERIISVFQNNLIGIVEHVDLVSKMDTTGTMYNSAYIHFKSWFHNSISENLQEKIMNPEKVARIVYDDPWFWIILENTATIKKVGSERRKISINLSELTSNNHQESLYVEPYNPTDEDYNKMMEYELLLDNEILKLHTMRKQLKKISEEEFMNNYPLYV